MSIACVEEQQSVRASAVHGSDSKIGNDVSGK